jgi:hypothetical protein
MNIREGRKKKCKQKERKPDLLQSRFIFYKIAVFGYTAIDLLLT